MGRLQGEPAGLVVAAVLPRRLRRQPVRGSSWRTTNRSSSATTAASTCRSSSRTRRPSSAACSRRRPTTARSSSQELVRGRGGWMIWPPVPYAHDTIDYGLPGPAPLSAVAAALAGYGRRRQGCARGPDLRDPAVLPVRSGAHGAQFDHRRAGGRRPGLPGRQGDLFGQRLIEIWAGLPILFVLIILASIVESNVFWLLGILVAFSWMALVGLVRAEVLRARNFQYVTAARALGAGDRRILRRHVLPNAMVATATFLPFILTGSITLLTSLDFSARPAAGRAFAGEAARPGPGQPARALAGRHVVLHPGDAADARHLHRRGRCATPSIHGGRGRRREATRLRPGGFRARCAAAPVARSAPHANRSVRPSVGRTDGNGDHSTPVTPPTPFLEISDLGVAFDGVQVVHGLDLRLDRGEVRRPRRGVGVRASRSPRSRSSSCCRTRGRRTRAGRSASRGARSSAPARRRCAPFAAAGSR